MQLKTEVDGVAAVPETEFSAALVKTEEEWDTEGLDFQIWDENFNKQMSLLGSHSDAPDDSFTIQVEAKSDSLGFPSFSEIQKSLEIVRRAFPETFTDEVIDSLFKHLIDRMSNPEVLIPSPPVTPKYSSREHSHTSKTNTHEKTNSQKSKMSGIGFHPLTPKKRYRTKLENMFPGIARFQSLHEKRLGKDHKLPNTDKGIAGRLDKVWTPQFEETLLQLYKKGNQFSFIRDHFQMQHPQIQQTFTVNSLRGRFYKVIRQTVRKLYMFIDKIGRECFPRMVKLSYNVIQNVMYFQEGRELRCLLIDLYFCERLNKTLVDRIIDSMLRFIEETKHMDGKKQHRELD